MGEQGACRACTWCAAACRGEALQCSVERQECWDSDCGASKACNRGAAACQGEAVLGSSTEWHLYQIVRKC